MLSVTDASKEPTTHGTPGQSPRIMRDWIIATAVCVLAPLLIYLGTSRSIVAIWNSSETFAHGYIILPISAWLLWRRRAELAQVPVATFWPGIAARALLGFGWMLAELADVQVVRQYALVAMIPVAALTLMGLAQARRMAFPLLFLLFAVPFGEVFIEPLIEFTANFTVASLQMTGIPVLRQGNTFEIPSGTWSVVEACSGVRYLIASITLGSLYAYLTYRSRVRQVLFLLLSVVVPIIANGMRAYMIVMIGHLSGMTLAVGVDHLIYGWLFFGLVMFLMFWLGGLWREDDQDPPEPSHANAVANAAVRGSVTLTAAAAVLATMAIWPLWVQTIARANHNPATPHLETLASSWSAMPGYPNFRPAFFEGAAQFDRLFQSPQSNGGQVGLSLTYYRNQSAQSKLISSENKIVKDKDPYWRRLDTGLRHETVAERKLLIRESRVQGATGTLLVWNFYWIDGHFTANDYFAKLMQAKQSMLLQGDDGASVALFASYGEHEEDARQRLRLFLTDNLGGIERVLSANRQP